jgi:hypothetical protein
MEMRKSVSVFIGMAVAVALVGTACSDVAPTAPSIQRVGSTPQNLLGLGGVIGGTVNTLTGLLIPPVHRTTPLPADVSWSFTAGPGGAVSSNSEVGLTIVIPYGALSSTETITVTALAGAPVAYRFEPHLTFSKKVSLTQNTNGTDVDLLGSLLLSGAHFEGDNLELNADGLAIVTETVPAFLSLFTHTATFNVGHFSGWILASGEADPSGEANPDGAY